MKMKDPRDSQNNENALLLADVLKERTGELGINLRQLAERSQVPIKTLRGWLNKKITDDLVQLRLVARALDLSIEELVFGSVWLERNYEYELVLYRFSKGHPKERLMTMYPRHGLAGKENSSGKNPK